MCVRALEVICIDHLVTAELAEYLFGGFVVGELPAALRAGQTLSGELPVFQALQLFEQWFRSQIAIQLRDEPHGLGMAGFGGQDVLQAVALFRGVFGLRGETQPRVSMILSDLQHGAQGAINFRRVAACQRPHRTLQPPTQPDLLVIGKMVRQVAHIQAGRHREWKRWLARQVGAWRAD